MRKPVEKMQVSWKHDKNNGHFTWRLCTFVIVFRIGLLRVRNIWGKIIYKLKHTLYVRNIFFFRKSCRLWDKVKKICYRQSDRGWQYNTTRAFCILNKQGYKPTLGIYNFYCSSKAKMIRRTRLNVTSFVYCLSCSIWVLCLFWRIY